MGGLIQIPLSMWQATQRTSLEPSTSTMPVANETKQGAKSDPGPTSLHLLLSPSADRSFRAVGMAALAWMTEN
jgi:hypothetical protein